MPILDDIIHNLTKNLPLISFLNHYSKTVLLYHGPQLVCQLISVFQSVTNTPLKAEGNYKPIIIINQ